MKILETHIVPATEEEIRLQEYAPMIFKAIPTRSGIKKAIKRGEILINGKVGKTSDWVRPNQKLELLQQKKEEKKVFQLKLEVLYEDEHLAVINKPSGYPTSGNYFRTIENALSFNLQPSKEPDALPYPVPVHRLDNPTSGILLIAKTRPTSIKLHVDFENREIHKTYIAIVSGETPSFFTCEEEIDDKPSRSSVKTLQTFSKKEAKYSIVEVVPETGRTHQIRKHLSIKGFPIIGDKEYGSPEISSHGKGIYLAAVKLGFTHPADKKQMEFQLEIPKKFARLRVL